LPPLLDVDGRDPNVPARLTPCRSLSDTSIGHQREIYTRRAAPTTIHVTQLTGFCAKHVARVGVRRIALRRFLFSVIPAQLC